MTQAKVLNGNFVVKISNGFIGDPCPIDISFLIFIKEKYVFIPFFVLPRQICDVDMPLKAGLRLKVVPSISFALCRK